jgi:hypothetical protein
MINTRFELYKLRRELKRNGKDYTFRRRKLNKFNEPIGELEDVLTIRCLYHEVSSFKTTSTGDSSTTVTEKQPMLLCAVEDVKDSGLEAGDFIEVDDSVYGDKKVLRFVGIVDIQNYGIIADISLEVVDDGFES